mmetsp:Transcript_48987/g.78053  ORF Transcript_48987/g.78053 Transcript_48987/m.78053 type:complete len:226 (-) Transcript_48987:347-1024(-)
MLGDLIKHRLGDGRRHQGIPGPKLEPQLRLLQDSGKGNSGLIELVLQDEAHRSLLAPTPQQTHLRNQSLPLFFGEGRRATGGIESAELIHGQLHLLHHFRHPLHHLLQPGLVAQGHLHRRHLQQLVLLQDLRHLLDDADVAGFGHCRKTSRGWIALHQFPVIAHEALPRRIEADPTVLWVVAIAEEGGFLGQLGNGGALSTGDVQLVDRRISARGEGHLHIELHC